MTSLSMMLWQIHSNVKLGHLIQGKVLPIYVIQVQTTSRLSSLYAMYFG